MKDTQPASILVIKLGALGDFVQAMGAFKAIRAHHRDARITLLTTAPYAGLGEACGYFDEVWIDSRPKAWQVSTWLELSRRLRSAHFQRVYDLQTSDRTNAYFHLFGLRRPEWSGVAWGCSHRHVNPRRNQMHPVECKVEQLAVAGIPEVPEIDLSWATADLDRFRLGGRFALLVPGASVHRPEKRWPAAQYAALATKFTTQGLRPLLIGTAAERDILTEIARGCPGALNLCGQTGFKEIVELARRAEVAVGNDTGPMHLIAAAGCPSVVLYSSASDPARTAPRGPCVEILTRPGLADLSCEEVIAALPPH
ncbi:MAG: glycosyltransferase family 9 protein [Alphaproteobacteria bacterium]